MMKNTVGFAFLAIMVLAGCNHHVYDGVVAKQIPKEEFLPLLDSVQNEYLIDVRTQMEYDKEHLPNALSISFLNTKFGKQVSELDTTRPIFLYCETAHRSPFATKKLKKLGFEKIYDLKGGYATLRP